jgi:DNA polymerase I-like protein with 3'-5' exonuclease and polymerase domains
MLIASYAPAYALFRDPWVTGNFQCDLNRFSRMIKGHLRRGPSRLEIDPRPEDVAAVVSPTGYVTVDVETGPSDPSKPWTAKHATHAVLRTIGLGNADWALSHRYGMSTAVETAIGNLLSDPRVLKVYQNGPYYDIPILGRYGMPSHNYADTRDMRKALSATSRLGLKYLATLYDDCPPWAEEDEEDDEKVIFTKDWPKLQTYNAWDGVETARVFEGLLAEPGWATPRVQRLYEVFHRLSHIASGMRSRGLHVDFEKRQWLADHLAAEYDRRERAFLEAVGIPGMRCCSNDMRALIYKKHATPAISRFNLPDPISPKMWNAEHTAIKVDQGSLLMVYVDPGTPKELCEIINLYWQAEAVWKARSTFVVSDMVSEAILDDNRLHPAWNSCGTDTGRFSCSSPNVQTLSKAKEEGENLGGDMPNIRQMYRAAPGKKLAEADWSQLELQVMRAVSGDEVLGQALASGDVYTDDAKAIFGLHPSMVRCECEGPCLAPTAHVKPSARQRGKLGHLAFQYAAGVDAIYRQMIKSDRTVTYPQVSLIVSGLKKRYARTVEYWYEEQARVLKAGYSESRILGQRRVYPKEPPITEIANYPIQSTAADVANLALIALDAQLPSVSKEAAIVGQFHDAFVVEYPDDPKIEGAVKALLKECMEREYEINGVKRRFPAKIKVGVYWSDC